MKTHILLLLIFIFACNKKQSSELSTSKNIAKKINIKIENKDAVDKSTTPINYFNEKFNDKEKLNVLIEKALVKADTVAYWELWSTYNLSKHNKEFLYIALFMANNNDYPKAYFDVYDNLMLTNILINNTRKRNFNNFDFETRNLAFSYLKKAAAKGYQGAKDQLKNYDENGILY